MNRRASVRSAGTGDDEYAGVDREGLREMSGGNYMFRKPLVIVLALLGLITGCATDVVLRPASEATRAPGTGFGATATQSKVRIHVAAEAWNARPYTLSDKVTPLLVEIVNDSDQPLRLRYEEFKLEPASGPPLAALPPYEIHGSVVKAVPTPEYRTSRFSIAPYLAPFYPRYRAGVPYTWTSPYNYYDRYYPSFRRTNLPTADMLNKALPEGVLEPGGRMTGFLYFEDLDENRHDDRARVRFVANLVNAKSGASLGTVSIPFVAVAS